MEKIDLFDYASVIKQAGIYAGDQDYVVDVNKNTQLNKKQWLKMALFIKWVVMGAI